MFGDIERALRRDLADRDYAEGYAKEYLNSFIATQIKVIREQRGMTQGELGTLIGTTQGGVSRIEDVNYSSWSMRTLMKLAAAFDVRLHVSFEPYGTLPDEVIRFDRRRLERMKRTEDPGIGETDLHEEADETLDIVDIGAWKALEGIQPDLIGGYQNGNTGNNKGKITGLDGTGLSNQRRSVAPIGLHSAAGEQIRLPEIPLQA